METLPLIFAYVGMAVMLALACVGSAIGVSMGGNSAIAAMKKNPDIFGKSMILCALPSTQGLYGFAGFFLMLSRLKAMDGMVNLNQGLALFAAGLALGIVGLYSGIKQASVVANGINEMSNGNDVFSNTMILAVFPELYAILAFAASFLALP
jgi:V/A-type H+-transporting ATPase subunit K